VTAESQAAETDFAEPIEQKIDKALEPIADPHRRGKAAATILQAVSKELYSGPLPHPSHFQRFENILPGSADRILAMAERQECHRIWWEQFALKAQFFLALIGLASALVISIGLIWGAVRLGTAGHEWLGGALVAASAVGMVTSFIKGRSLFSGPSDEEEPPPHQPRGAAEPKK
jgi:uncharacterized membrane protein